MKKQAIVFAVGLGLGLGGSTAAVIFLGGGDGSLSDSYAEAVEGADSTHAAGDGAHADTLAAADSLASDSTTVAHGAVVSDSTGHTVAVPGQPVAVTALASGPAAEGGMSAAQLAELFATMQAREAARVLEHMEDGEVQTILAELGNREAAAILSNLTPERAAVISRAILRGERSTP